MPVPICLSEANGTQRNVAVEDIVWLCDQNAMRRHFKLGQVVSVKPDSRGIVRDVNVSVVPNFCTPVTKATVPDQPATELLREDAQSTVLHKDVRCLVLLPVEEQAGR